MTKSYGGGEVAPVDIGSSNPKVTQFLLKKITKNSHDNESNRKLSK